ncbi:hypothetical protein WKH27_02120 [Pantoea agglomerans]|uniref:hypothetical protein n=1 Tax=Enterobacter agglomerans TaxID=549 RepID=UPI00289D835F|nr:hypothetical protein [Pantoea agglomerans]WNK55013.1 hypothetical protein RM154_08255 [Pantoea agglomerans]
MRLNRIARQEVQNIAYSLPESELEFIAAEVDARMNQHKTNPLMPALCAFLTKHYDYPAIEIFDEDDEQHEAAEAFLREAMVRVARREIAIGIYRNKHGNQEAA